MLLLHTWSRRCGSPPYGCYLNRPLGKASRIGHSDKSKLKTKNTSYRHMLVIATLHCSLVPTMTDH